MPQCINIKFIELCNCYYLHWIFKRIFENKVINTDLKLFSLHIILDNTTTNK